MQAPDLVQARAMLLVIIFACAATQEMGEDLNLWGSSSSLGLLSLLDNDGTQLRDLLVSAAAQVTPVGPNLVPREPSNGQPATTKARRSTPEADDTQTSKQAECLSVKEEAFTIIEQTLQESECYAQGVQRGSVDFGFLGTEDETDNCGGQNCAYTNPSSPYGLVVLPFNKDEDAGKATSPLTPDFVREDIKMRGGVGSHGWLNIDGGLGLGQLLRSSLQRQQQQRQQQSAQQAHGFGHSASFQLLPEEVVVVAGCIPSSDASRYWSWVPYVHEAWDEQRSSWVTVFASMSDGIGTYQLPLEDGSLPGQMVRNRLNSTLPSVLQARSNELMDRPSAKAQAFPFEGLRDLDVGPSLQTSEIDGGPESDDPSSQFTVVIMTASRAAANKVKSLLTPKLKDIGLAEEGEPRLFVGEKAMSKEYASSDIRISGSSQTPFNLLPIPQPFVQGAGLDTTSPYFMLIARSIVPSGQLDKFVDYAQGSPLRAWRLTPSAKGPLENCPNALTEWQEASDAFPLPDIVSRFPEAASSGPKGSALQEPPESSVGGNSDGPDASEGELKQPETQDERWLEPAMEWLVDALEQELRGSGDHPSGSAGVWPGEARGSAAAFWGLGSDHALGAANVEWGLQCYNRRIEFCNGDNRDAQYVASLPMVSLARPSKVLYLVGVNHAATGLAAYTNIAPSDPIQRLGLQTWTDIEMRGSADSLMAAGPYKHLSKYFFLVAFSRDCTGIPYCKSIPYEGARSLPMGRAALIMLRAYVNPQTGVGPDMSRMVRFRAVAAVPASRALPTDNQKRYPAELFAATPCKPAMTAATLSCALDLTSPVVQASSMRNGVELGPGIWHTIQALRSRPGQDCCQAMADWEAAGCACDEAGLKLLQGLVPIGRMRATMVSWMQRLCGQGVNASSLACMLSLT